MNYQETLDSFEALHVRAFSLTEDGTKVLVPYADYGSAVFGYSVVSKQDLSLPGRPAGSSPGDPSVRKAAATARFQARAAVLAAAPLVVWIKFGSELNSTKVLLPSLSDLVAFSAAHPDFPHFRDQDLNPCMADYSVPGRSVLTSVDRKTLSSAPVQLISGSAGLWPNTPWWATLGYVGMPSAPSSSQAMPSAAPRARASAVHRRPVQRAPSPEMVPIIQMAKARAKARP